MAKPAKRGSGDSIAETAKPESIAPAKGAAETKSKSYTLLLASLCVALAALVAIRGLPETGSAPQLAAAPSAELRVAGVTSTADVTGTAKKEKATKKRTPKKKTEKSSGWYKNWFAGPAQARTQRRSDTPTPRVIE
jgi:hypothetical protein